MNRLKVLEHTAQMRSFDQIYDHLKSDIELQMPISAILDSILVFCFKIKNELDEIKQCLNGKQDKFNPDLNAINPLKKEGSEDGY